MKTKSIINHILEKINLRVSRPFPRPFQKYNLMNKKDLVGVEIGVYEGSNILSLLKRSSIKKLYLIDPYECEDDYPDAKKYNIKKAEDIAHDKLFTYGDKIVWIKKRSDDAVNDIPDNLDFIYIDGNYLPEFYEKDIANYYPKLKQGGVLAGFIVLATNGDAIKSASEFAREKNLRLIFITPDWWIIKNEK